MQNWLNIWSSTSSVTSDPVSSLSAANASRRCTAQQSMGHLSSTVPMTSSSLSLHLSRHAACLVLSCQTLDSPPPRIASMPILSIVFCFISPRPSPVMADVKTLSISPVFAPVSFSLTESGTDATTWSRLFLGDPDGSVSTWLKTKTTGGNGPSPLGKTESRMADSSSVQPTFESITMSTASADLAAAADLSMPSLSTTSVAWSRIPAVSRSRVGMPPKLLAASTMSLVVPATSVTMARSAPDKMLRSELLPTFGAPMSASVSPFSKYLPFRAVSRAAWALAWRPFTDLQMPG
mmetsp:Transcript_2558/g.6027  ORF Transcript_2558/g.6027 Transcript_2558/m.6027 type:complete len:293 (+) Transcript_2558:970-1848(+)